jgi:hypothetical protein
MPTVQRVLYIVVASIIVIVILFYVFIASGHGSGGTGTGDILKPGTTTQHE